MQFSTLFKRKRQSGRVGLHLNGSGVAVARIAEQPSDALPQLAFCQFHPADSGELADTLQRIASELDLGLAECASVMTDDSFNLLLVERPEVDSSELKSAVRWRIKDLLDFHVDDAVFDVFDVPGLEERGRPRMMYVVAARTARVQEHIDLLEGAGVGLQVIDIPELAQRNIAALLPEDPTGVALLHLGAEGGLLTLTREGNLYLSRSLELGTRRMVAELPPVEPHIGDGEFTLEPEASELPPGLRQLFDAVVLEVQRSIDYYESHFAMPPVSGLVIAPQEQPVPGLSDYLSVNLGVPVRTLDLNALVDTDEPLSDELQACAFHAIGEALRKEARAL